MVSRFHRHFILNMQCLLGIGVTEIFTVKDELADIIVWAPGFPGQIKVENINLIKLRSNAVDTPNALHDAGWVPGQVIIDQSIGTVQVDPFRQKIYCDKHIVTVILVIHILRIETVFDQCLLRCIAAARKKMIRLPNSGTRFFSRYSAVSLDSVKMFFLLPRMSRGILSFCLTASLRQIKI